MDSLRLIVCEGRFEMDDLRGIVRMIVLECSFRMIVSVLE